MSAQLPVHLEQARERAVQLLSHHYAYDRLTLEQVEDRLDRAYRARSIGELDGLLTDLPAIPQDALTTGERQLYQLAPEHGAGVAGPAGEQRLSSIFAEVKRRGSWAPPRRLNSLIVFGSMLLDLREAWLNPEVTEVAARVVFGELTVIVPPGVRVVSEGSAIMGSFDHNAPNWDSLPPDAPTVRITGSATFGSVTVKVRLPGESALAALRRRWGV